MKRSVKKRKAQLKRATQLEVDIEQLNKKRAMLEVLQVDTAAITQDVFKVNIEINKLRKKTKPTRWNTVASSHFKGVEWKYQPATSFDMYPRQETIYKKMFLNNI